MGPPALVDLEAVGRHLGVAPDLEAAGRHQKAGERLGAVGHPTALADRRWTAERHLEARDHRGQTLGHGTAPLDHLGAADQHLGGVSLTAPEEYLGAAGHQLKVGERLVGKGVGAVGYQLKAGERLGAVAYPTALADQRWAAGLRLLAGERLGPASHQPVDQRRSTQPDVPRDVWPLELHLEA